MNTSTTPAFWERLWRQSGINWLSGGVRASA